MRDLNSNIKTSRLISPAAIITGNGTTTSQIINRAGYDSLEMVFATGEVTDGSWTTTIYESDASDMTGETAVAAADLIGLTAGANTFATSAANGVQKVGYKGSKQYVRSKSVQAGATTGGFLAAVAIQGHAKVAPVA